MTFRLPLLIAGFAAVALAGSGKLARDLTPSAGNNVAVIVQYGHRATAADLEHLAASGGWAVRSLPSVGGAAVHLPAARLAALAASPEIAYITPDRRLRRSMDHTGPSVGADVAQSY